MEPRGEFMRPSTAERVFSRLFGALVRIGIGLPHNYLLQVRGRKSGRMYSTPVDVLEVDGRLYLVCGRGRAQWVRNAEASGTVTLVKGVSKRDFALRAVADTDKPRLLKSYLDRFKPTVQRYFPVAAGSPPEAFEPYVRQYPVFELITSS
jgi:deazaflavin-dependent oxidoreductase (nitroreductase family)